MDSCEEAIKNGGSVNREELRAAENEVGVSHADDDLRIPAKNDRVAVVPALEEHLAFSTECAEEVVAILAIFMLCSHCRESGY